MKKLIEIVAEAPTSVLVLGETGTGKELAARAIHAASGRGGRLVSVNCAAIPSELLESEIFGHEKGAFTGADKPREGRVELAKGGTLFLDEIGDMPLPLQTKLLRVLENRTVQRVGGNDEIEVDFRLVCATHQNIQSRVDDGAFRADLYYRINVFPIQVPSLAERHVDIPLIASTILAQLAEARGGSTANLDDSAMSELSRYPWPGNVREMINKVKRAIIMADGKRITAEDLVLPLEGCDTDFQLNLRQVREAAERKAIIQALTTSNFNMAQASRLLGVTRPTLYNLTDKYRIETNTAPNEA